VLGRYNVVINWHLNSHVSEINLNKSNLKIKCAEKYQSIPFHVLANCEGEKRETVAVINKAIQVSNTHLNKFEFAQIESSNTFHMAIKIKIKEPTNETSNEFIANARQRYATSPSIQKEVDEFVNQIVTIGNQPIKICDLPFLFDPNIYKEYFYTDNWVPKYFVAGAIPKEIHEITSGIEKQKVLLAWASNLLAHNFKMPPDIFVIDAKQSIQNPQLRALTFISDIKYVLDPVIVLPNGNVIALLGDACMSPYYWEGISSTIGLNEAIVCTECIFSKQKTTENYQELRQVYNTYKNFIASCVEENSLESRHTPS